MNAVSSPQMTVSIIIFYHVMYPFFDCVTILMYEKGDESMV